MQAEPFTVDLPDELLADLRARLRNTNWPGDYENDDWRYGTHERYLRELTVYWRDAYDWRAQERAMNAFHHYRVTLDGVPVHYIHERGRGPRPFPLILTHGWPWTFWDYRQVIGPLADPAAYGGDAADAFDVVVPSLPGYAFSTPLRKRGINFWTTADLWLQLMANVLGYGRFGAQGGDWGALVSAQLGHRYAGPVAGILTSGAIPLSVLTGDSPWARAAPPAHANPVHRRPSSHVAVQTLDPQSLAYGMHDSPVGLCAWILERRRSWSDCAGDVERVFSKDDLLTTMTLYWATNSFATSARFYAEAIDHPWRPSHDRSPVVEAPTAISFFDGDMTSQQRDWVREYYNVRQLRSHARGGHFAAAENPEAIVNDVRDFFRTLR